MAKIRIKNAGKIAACLIRGIAATLRLEVRDEASVFETARSGEPERQGQIFSFWHNRMFLVPWLRERWLPHLPGTILTSPSGDGQIIADLCAEFGLEAERGSSSRPEKGMSALIALAKKARQGYVIGITPDGPRGPCYRLQPGIVKLGQLTGVPIIPVHVQYSRAFKFKTWDGFLLPLPFTKVMVVFDKPHTVPRQMTEAEFEQKRAALEEAMRAGTELESLQRC